MLVIAIDALVLMGLLKAINDDDIGFGTSAVVAFVASIGTIALAAFLVSVMGIGGVLVAAIVAALLLGVAVSALFGVEIKRSMLIGFIFMVVHIGVQLGFNMMLAA